MNSFSTSLLFCLLSLSTAFAQMESTPDLAPQSSPKLPISLNQKKRIAFLEKVAEAYAQEQDLPAAVAAYERILEIDPGHEKTRFTLSTMYLGSNQYRKAEKLLLELIETSPNDFRLWNNLGWLYATAEDLSLRDGQKAIKFAHEALTLVPYDYHVWSTLSEAYYVSGEYEKAFRAATHMVSLASSSKGITKQLIENYNKQLHKCKRALDAANIMSADE